MNNSAINYWSNEETPHRYVWSSTDIEDVFARPLYRSLIASDALQRLADVRFLGAIDYLIHPTGRQLHRRRHNRLEHTLGVAHLALIYARTVGLNVLDEMFVVAAALLHDVGHSPLSHSLESVFKKEFGFDHHQAGIDIVLSRVQGGFGKAIGPLLRSEKLDPEAVTALFSGSAPEPFNFLFSHPINIDTIEAISRSQTYIKQEQTSASPQRVLAALLDPSSAVDTLDNFWILKDRIYKFLIQGPVGLIADYIARNYVETHISDFSSADYFKSERELRRSNPGLFLELESTRSKITQSLSHPDARSSTPVTFSARSFSIDQSKAPGDPARYRQSKVSRTIEFRNFLNLSSEIAGATSEMDF
jgi:putative nucleotidyltransferase with HDIG domain